MAALPQVFGSTRAQPCWVLKTADVLDKLPKYPQVEAMSDLHLIWMAATRERACAASDNFVESYAPMVSKCGTTFVNGISPDQVAAHGV